MHKNDKRFLPYKSVVISNLLLAVLPILIMFILFFSESSVQVKNEMLELRRVNLEQTQQGIDTSLRNFRSMVLYASLDEDLTPYQLRKNNYEAVMALHHLKQHASILSDMEIYFYVHNDHCLYSTTGRMDFSTFEKMYRFENWTAVDFFTFISQRDTYGINPYRISPSGCFLKSNGRDERYISILYPWQYHTNAFGTVIALISEDWLLNRLNISGTYNDKVYLLDGEGKSIVGDPLPEDIVWNETIHAQIDGEKADCIWLRSPLTGWTYMTYVPYSRISALLYGRHMWIYLTVLALALCFSTLGICLAIRYYLPVQNLQDVLSVRDEPVEEVHDRVLSILENNEDMKSELEETREYLLQDFLLQMFRGHLLQRECIKRSEKMNLPLKCAWYAAVVVKTGPDTTTQSVSEALDVLLREGMLAADNSDMQDHNLLILYAGGLGEGHFAEKDTDRIVTALEKLNDFSFRIGIGQAYAALSEVRQSYIEALAALRSDSEKGICYFDELTESHFKLVDTNLFSQQIRLTEMIRQGNTTDVEKSLDQLEEYVSRVSHQTDAGNLRFMMDSLLHDLMAVFSEVDIPNIDWKLNLAVHMTQPGQFLATLKPLCLQSARQFSQKRDTMQNRQSDAIMQYVDKHFMEHSLSQAMVAEKFNMTPTALSRLFNSCVGIRFIDYVSQKRLSYAAELLTNSEWGIQEIVHMVGYIDVSSFTRKFTAAYGMSPNVYRCQFSGNKEKQEQ